MRWIPSKTSVNRMTMPAVRSLILCKSRDSWNRTNFFAKTARLDFYFSAKILPGFAAFHEISLKTGITSQTPLVLTKNDACWPVSPILTKNPR